MFMNWPTCIESWLGRTPLDRETATASLGLDDPRSVPLPLNIFETADFAGRTGEFLGLTTV